MNPLKKVYGLCVILMLMMPCCRKKELDNVQQFKNYTPQFEHCSNYYQDDGELGVDCGGECEPCEQNTPPCEAELNDDKLNFNASSIPERSISLKTITNYEYRFEFEDGGYLVLGFDHQPNLTTNYSGALFADEESVTIDFSYSQWDPNRRGYGTIYVNYENGVYNFSACNVGLANSYGDLTLHISFKLIAA